MGMPCVLASSTSLQAPASWPWPGRQTVSGISSVTETESSTFNICSRDSHYMRLADLSTVGGLEATETGLDLCRGGPTGSFCRALLAKVVPVTPEDLDLCWGLEHREYNMLLPLTQIKISKFEDPKYLCLTTTNLRFLEHFSRGLKCVETSVNYHFLCLTVSTSVWRWPDCLPQSRFSRLESWAWWPHSRPACSRPLPCPAVRSSTGVCSHRICQTASPSGPGSDHTAPPWLGSHCRPALYGMMR